MAHLQLEVLSYSTALMVMWPGISRSHFWAPKPIGRCQGPLWWWTCFRRFDGQWHGERKTKKNSRYGECPSLSCSFLKFQDSSGVKKSQLKSPFFFLKHDQGSYCAQILPNPSFQGWRFSLVWIAVTAVAIKTWTQPGLLIFHDRCFELLIVLTWKPFFLHLPIHLPTLPWDFVQEARWSRWRKEERTPVKTEIHGSSLQEQLMTKPGNSAEEKHGTKTWQTISM